MISFEPIKPLTYSMYICDKRFHTEKVIEQLSNDENKFGFIIIDGKGALFATFQNNSRDIITKYSVDLPRKHCRGGQSSNRFANIRDEKRHNYLHKVSEIAVQCFITKDKINVSGLIFAGSADLKIELAESNLLDPRLKVKILKFVDISYGMELGLNEAINQSVDCLKDSQFLIEKNLLIQYFDEIARETGLYCFGIDETLNALETGSVKTLILWEELDVYRIKIQSNNDEKIFYTTDSNQKNMPKEKFEITEKVLLLDWLVENYKNYGTNLQIVTDRSQEGSQFCKGFGGIGGNYNK